MSKCTRVAQSAQPGEGSTTFTAKSLSSTTVFSETHMSSHSRLNTHREAQTRTHHGSTKATKKSVKMWSIPSHLPLRSNTFEV